MSYPPSTNNAAIRVSTQAMSDSAFLGRQSLPTCFVRSPRGLRSFLKRPGGGVSLATRTTDGSAFEISSQVMAF